VHLPVGDKQPFFLLPLLHYNESWLSRPPELSSPLCLMS